MYFKDIRIEIELSAEMEAAMPKGGPEEIEAIDKHNQSIEEATGKWLEGVVQDLVEKGYKVRIER